MMKRILIRMKTSIWLYPVIYSLIALVLAILVLLIDSYYVDKISTIVHRLFFTSAELAQPVLEIVAGSFITITTFTFSTTMVVLTMYSSQFTPRVVEDFLNNQTTMKSFGIFLSGFIYAITSLLFLSTNAKEDNVIAASVAVIYLIVGLIYFLGFVQSVATHIQASGLILRLYSEALGKIKHYVDFVKDQQVIPSDEFVTMIKDKKAEYLTSSSDGYIQEIDYRRLMRLAQEFKIVICFRKVVGQFISKETSIMTVYTEINQTLSEEERLYIDECVLVGNKKTEEQDFAFTIQKIVEIALKALSSSINDPNTAIHCLKNIGLLLRDLSDIKDGFVLMKNEDAEGFIVYESYDFYALLNDAYNQIVFYGQENPSVIAAVFNSMKFIKVKTHIKTANLIDDYAKQLFEKLSNQGYARLEYNMVYKEYTNLLNIKVKEDKPDNLNKPENLSDKKS
ncbi:MAG TPA: DUF2254 domain-containing protein [Bacillota bacterium]|nr:DUF2254 domain-containing protein [Bacillota bacterium]